MPLSVTKLADIYPLLKLIPFVNLTLLTESFDSSTVILLFTSTSLIAVAINLPIELSLFAEIVATCSTSIEFRAIGVANSFKAFITLSVVCNISSFNCKE